MAWGRWHYAGRFQQESHLYAFLDNECFLVCPLGLTLLRAEIPQALKEGFKDPARRTFSYIPSGHTLGLGRLFVLVPPATFRVVKTYPTALGWAVLVRLGIAGKQRVSLVAACCFAPWARLRACACVWSTSRRSLKRTTGLRLTKIVSSPHVTRSIPRPTKTATKVGTDGTIASPSPAPPPPMPDECELHPLLLLLLLP